MSKKKTIEDQFEIYDKNTVKFIQQMRNAGVTDKTIQQVLKEIQEYQQKLMIEQLEEALKRFRQIAKEAMERND